MERNQQAIQGVMVRPSAMKIGSQYIVYYDHYRDPKRMQAVQSKDLRHWSRVDVRFPQGSKHASFIEITKKEAERLRSVK